MKLKELIYNLEYQQLLGVDDIEVEGIQFDSRKVGDGDLFVAVNGAALDGHRFISSALENGAKVVVVEILPESLVSGVTYVKVADSASFLGALASQFYANPSHSMKVVGVTGTNGKTTIATLLFQLFRNLGYKVGLFSTIDIRINEEKLPATHTTPNSLEINRVMKQMVDAGCEYCFMEVSSHAVHQKRIAALDFDGAIFTNLTHDHLDYHETFREYLKAKKTFFDNLSSQAFALTNIDDKNGMIMLQNTDAKKVTYSQRSLADYQAKIIEPHFDGMLLNIASKEVWTHFVGKFNVSNLLAVYSTAKLLGQTDEEVLIKLSQLEPVSGRFETIKSREMKLAIIDYAHTPDALKNVLTTINDLRTKNEQVITVVGAGGDRDKTKRPEMAKEACLLSDRVILTSDNPRTEQPDAIIKDMQAGVESHYQNKVLSIVDRREAIRTACILAQAGDIILVAGKGHEDYQEIDGVKHHFDDKEVIKEVFEINE